MESLYVHQCSQSTLHCWPSRLKTPLTTRWRPCHSTLILLYENINEVRWTSVDDVGLHICNKLIVGLVQFIDFLFQPQLASAEPYTPVQPNGQWGKFSHWIVTQRRRISSSVYRLYIWVIGYRFLFPQALFRQAPLQQFLLRHASILGGSRCTMLMSMLA